MLALSDCKLTLLHVPSLADMLLDLICTLQTYIDCYAGPKSEGGHV